MAFQFTLPTLRDEVRFAVGDIDDANPKVPGLNEAGYDGLIAKLGPVRAAVSVIDLIIANMPTAWKDSDASEDLSKQVEHLQSRRAEIIAGTYPFQNTAYAGASLRDIERPDLENFEQL